MLVCPVEAGRQRVGACDDGEVSGGREFTTGKERRRGLSRRRRGRRGIGIIHRRLVIPAGLVGKNAEITKKEGVGVESVRGLVTELGVVRMRSRRCARTVPPHLMTAGNVVNILSCIGGVLIRLATRL